MTYKFLGGAHDGEHHDLDVNVDPRYSDRLTCDCHTQTYHAVRRDGGGTLLVHESQRMALELYRDEAPVAPAGWSLPMTVAVISS